MVDFPCHVRFRGYIYKYHHFETVGNVKTSRQHTLQSDFLVPENCDLVATNFPATDPVNFLGTQMTSILKVNQPPKTRPKFQSKQGSVGFQVHKGDELSGLDFVEVQIGFIIKTLIFIPSLTPKDALVFQIPAEVKGLLGRSGNFSSQGVCSWVIQLGEE